MTGADRQLYETPPRCSADASAETALNAKTEVGFTLQTLIVMAVFVLAAVGAGIGLIAVTSSSSDDFEDAGKTGVEERCAPNEVNDPELEARGVAGVNQTYRRPAYKEYEEIVADEIGCNPVCATWEYYDPGLAAEGIGGPEGNGGVYSTDEGCFAPCYWEFSPFSEIKRPKPGNLWGAGGVGSGSRLHYFDDNRAPVVDQFRLGVNYRRSSTNLDEAPPNISNKNTRAQHNDLDIRTPNPSADGKPIFWTKAKNVVHGARRVAGTPLHPAQIAYGLPTVYKPNWFSQGADPGSSDPKLRNGNDNWEDENWEVRADPSEGVCTIVNITLDDQVVCSSEWDDCRRS